MTNYASNLSFASAIVSSNSTNDPKSIIHQMLMMDEDTNTPPEDIILAWVLSLPNELDPALAATRLLSHYENIVDQAKKSNLKTIMFLKQTAEFPRSRLAATSRRRSRYRHRLHS
ncbi:hypothetical protein WH96_01240 [Kiloniella spongiae]|uniref:Uncharacterized protein n=1 Tax=Kiloniella spongiae TaxID=1489064 RepID=A0A0H2MHW6_9PROT|nr:hypothetical protein [Kiloniella spongiae]KLN62184.1 hypothetical protein WH96_01240 [Kiloniella spongiae]